MLLGLSAFEALDSLSGRAGAEKPLENQAWIWLRRERLRRRAPGEIIAIGAGITGVAISRLAHGIARQFKGGETSEMTDLLRNDLVDGNAGIDIRTGGFLDAHARQE